MLSISIYSAKKPSQHIAEMPKRKLNHILIVAFVFWANSFLSQTTVIIGSNSAANASTIYPCALGDYYGGQHAQYLYTNSVLSAAGLPSLAVITEIGWVANSTTISNHFIEDFTIKLANTSATSLSTNTWENSGSTVFGPQNYSYTSGQSGNISFDLINNYFYTGGGLLVDICCGSTNSTTTSNPALQWQTSVGYAASHTYRANNINGCQTTTATNAGSTTSRPRLVITYFIPSQCNSTPSAPLATLSGAASVCAGVTKTMTAAGFSTSSGLSTQWQVSSTSGGPYTNVSGGTGATTASYTTAALGAGTYYYVCNSTCIYSGLVGTSNEITVTVNALPTVAISAPNGGAFCGTQQMSATGASTYAWTPASSLSSTSGSSVTFTGTSSVTVNVSGTDANGCVGTASQAVTYTAPTAITMSSSVANFCGTGGATTISASSSAPYTYVFNSLDGAVLSNATASSVDATVSQTSAIQVTGTDAASGCAAQAVYSVGLYPLPTATVTTTASGVCPGTPATINSGLSAGNFSAVCIPVAPLTIPASAAYLANNGAMSVALTSGNADDGGWGNIPIGFNFNFFGTSYNTLNAGTNGVLQFGTYNATALGDFTIGALPNTVDPLGAIYICANDLNTGTAGTPNTYVRYWTEGYAPNRKFVIEYRVFQYGSTTNIVNVQAILYETLGMVDIVAKQVASTNSKSIGVNSPTGTIGATAPNCAATPNTASYWSGQTATISAAAPQAWRFSPPANYLTVWSATDVNGTTSLTTNVDGSTINAINGFSISVAPLQNTTYALSYANNDTGCSNFNTPSQITIYSLGSSAPTNVQISADVTQACPGNNFTIITNLNSSLEGLSYQWQVSTDYGLTWSIINGTTSSTLSISQTTHSIYRVSVSSCSGPGNFSNDLSIPLAILPTVSLSNSQELCLNGTADSISVNLSFNNGSNTYNWFYDNTWLGVTGIPISNETNNLYPLSLSHTTQYYCNIEIFGTNCILTSPPSYVIFYPQPEIAYQPISAQTNCINTPSTELTFSVSYSPGGQAGVLYQWYTNSIASYTGAIAIENANSQTYLPETSSLGNTYYFCVATSTGPQCSFDLKSNIVESHVINTLNVIPATQNICGTNSIQSLEFLNCQNLNDGIYQWFSNNIESYEGSLPISSGGNTAQLIIPNFGIYGTTYYYCEVFYPSSGTTIQSSIAQVSIFQPFSYSILPLNEQTLCSGGTFTPLTISASSNQNNIEYQWYTFSYSNNWAIGNPLWINQVSSLIQNATDSTYLPPTNNPTSNYYYCEITIGDLTCNSPLSLVNILYDPEIQPQQNPNQTICVGGSAEPIVVITNSQLGSSSYQWYDANSSLPIPGENSNIFYPGSFSNVSQNSYYVEVSSTGNGCSTVNSETFTINTVNLPSVSISPTIQTSCQYGNLQPISVTSNNSNGPYTYQWYYNSTNSFNGGTPISGANESTYIPSGSNISNNFYYCIVSSDNNGCSVVSNSSQVIVFPAPTIVTQPTTSNVCVDGTANQMCVAYANGTGTPTFQWYSNAANNTTTGTAITGATTNCYIPPSTTAGTTYYYAIISLSGAGCSSITSNTAAVVISPDPIITIQPTATQTFCVGGSSVPLTVALQASTGIGTFTYQWYSNSTATTTAGTPIAGATAPSYNPPVFNTAGTFYYYCIVTDAGNGCGIVTSQVASVIVLADPIILSQPLATQTLCQTAVPATLSLSASGGTGTFLYQWYSNTVNNTTSGTVIPGATASTYSPPTATIGTKYYYCLITTASSGCSVTSATSAVVVTTGPTFTIQPSATSNVCVGGTTNQMCVAYINGPGTAAYQWYSNSINTNAGGTVISGATNSCYLPSSASAGTTYYYAVITFTGGGCSNITSNTAAVVITPDPVIATQPSALQTICVGGSSAALIVALQSSAGLGALTYQWYSNSTANNSGGTIISGATAATYTPPVINISGDFYFYCIVTAANNGCGNVTSQVAAVSVVADPIITVQPITTQTLCQTAAPNPLTVTASGGTGTFLYQWYSNTTNNTTSGTIITGATASTYAPPTSTLGTKYYYCVVITPTSGCSVTSATSAVIVNPAPTFTTHPAASNVCVGGTPTQMCVAFTNGTGTAVYQWYSNTANNTTTGAAIPSATTSCYTPSSTTAGTTYYYAIITLTGGGCASITSNTAAVVVNSPPTISTQPLVTQTVCVGGTATQLSVAYSNGAGSATYQWYSNTVNTYTNGNVVLGATTANYTPPSATAVTTYYYCIISFSASSGCSMINSNIAEIVVVSDPSISTQPITTQTICVGGTIATPLSVSYSGGAGTPNYQWYSSPSNIAISGATSTSYTPPTFALAGLNNYYVIVTLSGAGCGSITSNTASIAVVPDPTATVSSGASYCQNAGSVVALAVTVSGGQGPTLSYQWYSNTANSNAGGSIINAANAPSYSPPVASTGSTYYYCAITQSGTNCAASSPTAQIIVTSAPTFTSQPTATQSVCVGGATSQLSVAYNNGTGTASYQWYSNTTNTYAGGSAISAAIAANYTPPSASPGTTYYFCIISFSASGGCSMINSNIAEVLVITDPTISAQPIATQTLCQNSAPTVLNLTASGGTGTFLYQWYSNTANNTTSGTIIAGATASTYSPPTATLGTRYYYCVVTTTASGCSVTSNTSTLIVTTGPTFTIQPSATNSVCVGGTTNQMCVAFINGPGTSNYQWYSNSINSNAGGTIISGATNSCYLPSSASVGTTYYYAVITFTGGGCSNITSNTAAVVITPDPVIGTQPTATQTICVGGSSSSLSVALQAATGIGAFTYQWYSNSTATNSGGTLIAGATAPSYTPPVFNLSGTFYYYCVVAAAGNGCGTVTSQVATVVVVADPIITVQPITTQTLCQTASPATISVAASGGTGSFLYQWYSNATNNNTSGTLISGATVSTYSPPTATVGTMYYYCIVTTAVSGCSVSSATAAIIVNPAPNFTTQPVASTVCVGGSTNQMCVTYANGTGTPSYQWYSNTANTTTGGTVIPSATTNCYTPPSTTAETTYYYAIISLTGGGCSSITSNSAAVIIVPDPVIIAQPNISETICVGGSANSISVVSSGGIGGFTYQWYTNTTNSNSGGVIITGATGNSYSPGNFINPTINYYYVVISNNGNGCGSLNSTTSSLNVIQDPIVSVTPTFQNICTNGTISPISVSYSGGIGTATYQWYTSTNGLNTSGTPISGATSSSYSPPTNSVSNLFYYASINQSTSGCATNSNVSQLQISLSPTFSSQPTASQSVCIDGSPNPLTIGLVNAIGVPIYQWWSNNVNSTTNATAILGANSSTYTPLATNIGTTYYFCSVSFTASNCGYITSNISSVNVVADPIISTQPAALQTLCVGGTANILSVIATGGTGSFSYQWFSASTNSAIFGTNSLIFAPGTFNSASNNSYYVQVSQSGSGCNSLTSNTVLVNVVADPLATITSGASYCQNYEGVNPLSVIVVSGGEGTASYQWYSSLTSGNTSGNPISGATGISYTPPVNVTGNTYYYCVITQTGINCAVNTAASQIIVISSPSITTQPVGSQSRCVGASMIQLSVGYNNGTGIPTYQWYSNSTNTYTGGTAIPLANEAFYTPPNSTPGTLYYYCELTFQTGGCSAIYSNIASVILFPDPTISIQPLLSQTICAGGQAQIQPLSVSCLNQPGGVTYQWYREPNLQIANGVSAQYTPTQNSTGTFNYYVVISSSVAGCDMLTSNMSELIIAPDPIISEELNFVQALCPFAENNNSPTVIVDYSNEIAPPSYIWYEVNQGNSIPLPNSNQNAYFPQPPLNGSFNSQCAIQFDYPGCDVLTSAISVLSFEETNLDCYPQLNIADAFSPNNDGINDYWTITGLDKYIGFEINIFNSFGQNIYQLKNVLPNWDGTWNGEPLPNGDYFYSIKLIELNRTIFGTISIAK
jgi:gliding motility-associated-like protein